MEDIAVGSVLPPGGGATEFRAASLVAGFSESTAVKSLNRQCSSGLQACVDIANAIRSGMIEVGVGAGVESMSQQYGPGAVSEFSELLDSHPESKNCKVPMGVLSEQMAKDRSISRQDQDEFAAKSYTKALKAQKEGRFEAEISPMKAKVIDSKTDEVKELLVDRDDGIRAGVTAESLSKIKPAFAKDGSIHGKVSISLCLEVMSFRYAFKILHLNSHLLRNEYPFTKKLMISDLTQVAMLPKYLMEPPPFS